MYVRKLFRPVDAMLRCCDAHSLEGTDAGCHTKLHIVIVCALDRLQAYERRSIRHSCQSVSIAREMAETYP